MNISEMTGIMRIICDAYPSAYSHCSSEDLERIVKLWTEMLCSYRVESVLIGLRNYIATDTSGFPPSIGMIVSEIEKTAIPDEGKIMSLIKKAIRNSGYNSESEFEKLPYIAQKLVGSPKQLHDWALLPMDKYDTIVESNLRKNYRRLSSEIGKEKYERYNNEKIAEQIFKQLPV